MWLPTVFGGGAMEEEGKGEFGTERGEEEGWARRERERRAPPVVGGWEAAAGEDERRRLFEGGRTVDAEEVEESDSESAEELVDGEGRFDLFFF
mmetsp:Transcript_5990/g.12002  ORF Transcript_5990/g.12002 Transcript_5990/m.12002 type:complete len:94 (-) Transcript_5990:10-291(-)